MSDLDPSDPSDRRVDSLVGGFFAALTPTDSTALVRRVDDALTCAVSPRPTARRRAATGLAAVCVLALAITLLPVLQASHATPSTAVSSTPASATMTPASRYSWPEESVSERAPDASMVVTRLTGPEPAVSAAIAAITRGASVSGAHGVGSDRNSRSIHFSKSCSGFMA